jgi:hypothetical protein
MNDEAEEWCLRPVMAGKCSLESLLNGTVQLHHLAMLNEALDVQYENEAIMYEAEKPRDE